MADLKELIVDGKNVTDKVTNAGDYITMTLDENYWINAQNVYERLPLTSFANYGGNSFSWNSDGTVTVLRDCVVLVVGQAYFATGYSNNDWICAAVYCNNSFLSRGGATVHHSSPYISLGSTYVGWRVAGDIIDLRVLNETGARGYIGSAWTSTYLRVVALT